MLLEAVIKAAKKELDADKDGGSTNALRARLETMQGELVNFEQEKEQINDKFFLQAAARTLWCCPMSRWTLGRSNPLTQSSLGVLLGSCLPVNSKCGQPKLEDRFNSPIS